MAVAVPAPDPAADRAALLFERHYEAVFGYCSWRLRTRFDAEEAAQTTFARALAALRRGHHPRNERAWLVTIARNVCTTLGTAPHRTAEVVGDVPGGIAPTVDDGLAPELEAALAALPDGQRRALLLREWHELSYREIAAELGVSVGTVESWIFRARRSLASTLGSARRQLGLAAIWRALGPSTGAKVAATAALAGAVVATEQAVVPHAADDPPQRRAGTQQIAPPAAVPNGDVAASFVRAPKRGGAGKQQAARPKTPVAARTPVAPAPVIAGEASAPEPAKPSAPEREVQPAEPAPPTASAPASPKPSAPVESPPPPPPPAPPAPPPPPAVEVPSLPIEPPALPPVEPPPLPVATPELPALPPVTAPVDLPVAVPDLP